MISAVRFQGQKRWGQSDAAHHSVKASIASGCPLAPVGGLAAAEAAGSGRTPASPFIGGEEKDHYPETREWSERSSDEKKERGEEK